MGLYVRVQVDRYDENCDEFLTTDVSLFDLENESSFKSCCYIWLADYIIDLPKDDYEITFFLKKDGDYLGNMFYDLTRAELEFLDVFKSKICENCRKE